MYCFCYTVRNQPEILSFGIEGLRHASYVGGMVNLTCRAIADYVYFNKFTELVKEDERRTYQHTKFRLTMESKLMITNVSVVDAGNYTCTAGKIVSVETAHSSLTLRVG